MNMHFTRAVCMAGLATAALTLGAYARADQGPAARTLDPAMIVRFADLNPATSEGVTAIYGRIKSAAQTVCGPSFSLWDSNRYQDWKRCYRATIDRTVRRINLPKLTALHQARSQGWVSTGPLQAAASSPTARH